MKQPKITRSTIIISNTLHLSGGLRAGTHQSNQLMIYPSIKKKILLLSISDTRGYFTQFQKMGLDLMGHEEEWEKDGIFHSSWHLFLKGNKTGDDITNLWSGIAHTFHKNGEKAANDIAHDIVFSLRTSLLRLRDISREYGHQNEIAISMGVQAGLGFSNVRIFDLYMALHSFLVEMCAARDYLAKFISHQIFSDTKTDNMSELYKKLKNKPESHPVCQLVLNICDQDKPDAWMARLSRYRNIIAHRAPISRISEKRFLTPNLLVAGSENFFTIYLGVPSDPIVSMDTNYVDALSHFKNLLILMLEFAEMVGKLSGCVSELPHITENDMI